jgi:type VI secretion system protein VasG
VITEILSRCKEVESGARNVDHILTRTVLPEMSGEFLSRMSSGEDIAKVHITVGDSGQFLYEFS